MMSVGGRRRSLISRSARRPLVLFPVLLAIGLSVACTFERRPRTQVNADPGQVQIPVPDEPASSFLESLQSARAAGEPADVRPLLHPDIAVLLDGRRLSFDGAGGGPPPGDVTGRIDDAWSVVAGLPDGGGVPPQVTDSAVFDGSALFVVRYGPAVESLVLARDSTGWRLRLLHRGESGGDPR